MFTAKGHLFSHLVRQSLEVSSPVFFCCVNEDSKTCEQLQCKKLVLKGELKKKKTSDKPEISFLYMKYIEKRKIEY